MPVKCNSEDGADRFGWVAGIKAHRRIAPGVPEGAVGGLEDLGTLDEPERLKGCLVVISTARTREP